MPAPPLKEELSAPYPNPSNAVMRAGMGKFWDYVTGLLGATGNPAEARAALGFKRGADIASAATINLTTATGDLVDVTGTTTITAITLADGEERTVRFTGALTLTHGASLVLPGGANITTAAGDFAVFRGYASGVVRCVDYTRANGRALVSSDFALPSQSGHSGKALVTNGSVESWGFPDQLSTASGSAPSYAARAWANFNGTNGAIRASGNVSSVTRNGAGNYTLNFSSALPDANYGYTFGFTSDNANVSSTPGRVMTQDPAQPPSTTSLRVITMAQGSGGVALDFPTVSVSIFR